MMEKFFIEFTSFIVVSSMLLLVGYLFNIKLLMLNSYEETATRIEFGGSILPFIIGLICSYYIGNYYKKRQRVY